MSERDTCTWNTMISGYVEMCDMEEASNLFTEASNLFTDMPNPDVYTWNSMISGYAQIELFGLMKEERMKPTYITFVSLLNACANAGLPEEGRMHFKSMVTEYGGVGALLGVCKVHNTIKLARVAAEALIRLDPESSTPYVLLHNMYADIGQWDDATEVKKLMEKHNIKKAAGFSLVDSSSSMIGAARVLGFSLDSHILP
uniref:Pentatricopeptide repeat-containing protein n=1 Tax=Tanacetum cinerariifolium TaxID=118510 RepID=A0A699IW38_TANCI|nr:hypothetical protein [Tanacetum cinerariifolium]